MVDEVGVAFLLAVDLFDELVLFEEEILLNVEDLVYPGFQFDPDA